MHLPMSMLAYAGAALLAGCSAIPHQRLSVCRPDPIAKGISPAGTATVDVLTYNIEGLPWPARNGRKAKLRQIGDILRQLREQDSAPDIVLFQEAFSRTAVDAVNRTGYPSLVAGPSRTQKSDLSSDIVLPGHARPRRGEIGLRFMSGGLAIASRYPIIAVRSAPFSRPSCAGFDCLANKGVLVAHIRIPGAPDPLLVANTHMNAQRASRVAPERHLASHHAQADEFGEVLARQWDRTAPVIVGGDFNMRRAPARFDYFAGLAPLSLVHRFCLEATDRCDVRMSWDGDAPWMDTQDLQFFSPGARVTIEPIRVEAMFDGHPDSPRLSDHDGFRVIYRLEWKAGDFPSYRCTPTASASGE